MWKSDPATDEIITDLQRKGEIDKAVAVDMAELPFSISEFNAAEAMRENRNTLPLNNSSTDMILHRRHTATIPSRQQDAGIDFIF